jgi:hypothetical protein
MVTDSRQVQKDQKEARQIQSDTHGYTGALAKDPLVKVVVTY